MDKVNEWDALYQSGRHDTVGIEANFAQLIKNFSHKGAAVLELGCGMGANVPLFVSEGADYAGIDGSSEAVSQAGKRFPYLRGRFICADFTTTLPIHGAQIVCERASLSHNGIEAIQRCVDMIRSHLPANGLFISSDWFSDKHSEYGGGTALGQGTFTGYADGQFAGVGAVHFSDAGELLELFAGFECMYLVERVHRHLKRDARAHWHRDDPDYQTAVFDMVWRKQ